MCTHEVTVGATGVISVCSLSVFVRKNAVATVSWRWHQAVKRESSAENTSDLHRPHSELCHCCVCASWKDASTLFRKSTTVEKIFLWNGAKTVDSQSFSFYSVHISVNQRCVQAFQVTDVYVKLTKIGFLETQLFRYYIQLVMLNICP